MSAIASMSSGAMLPMPTGGSQGASFTSSITAAGADASSVFAASSLTVNGGDSGFLGALADAFAGGDLGKMLAAMIILNTLFGEKENGGTKGLDPKDMLMGLVALSAMQQASSMISSSVSLTVGQSGAASAYAGGPSMTMSTFSVTA